MNLVLVIVIGTLVVHKLRRPARVISFPSPAKRSDEASAVPDKREKFYYADIKSPSGRRRSVIDQLRAMGVPNDLLALVARVDFEAGWESRFKSCHGDMDKMAAVQLEMNMSKDAEMRAALGEEGFKQWDQKYMLWEAMSTKVAVTPAEADAIYALKKKLQRKQFEVEQARLKGTIDDAGINDAYDKAYSEYYTNLKSVLGDQRYAESQQLDDAFVGGNLRYQLASVNPTEAQFQELFKVEQGLKQARSELDHQFQNNPSSREFQEKANALNEAHDLEYQRILGSDAFNALKKAQDPAYSQMKKYEALWGLDENKIDKVYSTLQNFQSAAADYQNQLRALQAQGRGADAAAINGNLQKLAAQTEQTLQGYVGPDTYNRLQRNHVLPFNQRQPLQRGPL